MTPAEIVKDNHRRAYLDACREALAPIDYDRPAAKQAFEDGVRRDDYVVSVALCQPVGEAFLATRERTTKWATKFVGAWANAIFNDLRVADWDVAKAAPFPLFDDRLRRSKRARYDAFRLFTRPHEARGGSYVEPDTEALASYMGQAVLTIEMQFDLFIVQTVATIGLDVVSAQVHDVGVTGALLHLIVERPSGVATRWEIERDATLSPLGNPKVTWTLSEPTD
jgi:hypothetical protein